MQTFKGHPTLKYHLNFTKACNSGSELAISVLFGQKRSILLISLPQTAPFRQSREVSAATREEGEEEEEHSVCSDYFGQWLFF